MTREENLPRDVDALIALIAKEREANDKVHAELLAKVAALEHRVHVLSSWSFAPRSERRVIEPLPAGPQACFPFMLPHEEAQRLADQTGAQGSVTLELPRSPRKHTSRRTEFPEHLPHTRTEVEISADKRQCCGHTMEPMGQESTKVLERIESTVVHEIARIKYSCRVCQARVLTAPLPTRGLDRSLLGNSFLAHLAIERFAHHMPYHRLEQKYASEGLALDRSTLCRSMIALSERFEPVMAPLAEEVRSEGVAFADESPVVFQEAPSSGKRQKGWMWIYANRSGDYIFDVSESRSGESPTQMLADFDGYLHVDGYAVYPAVTDPQKVKLVACWAHARRGFVEAEASEKKFAQQAIGMIRKLFEIEELGQTLAPDERQKLREERAPPLLEDFRNWCEATLPKVYPAGALAKAIKYCLDRWGALVRYIEDPRLEISNNRSERAIKAFATGRKNWEFVGNERGGRAAAIFNSLIATCQARAINLFDYFFDAMLRLAEGGDPAKLTPCEWQRRFQLELAERRRYVEASVRMQVGH